jgi:hypothetical protein
MNSTKLVSIIMITLLIVFVSGAISAPIIPITFTIEGKIKEVVWQPRKFVRKGIPGMSGSLGNDSYSLAQYQIVISDFTIKADDERSQSEVERLKRSNEVTIFLTHEKEDGFLKKGMNIKVINYCIKGDEGGNWYSYEKIIILEPSPGYEKEEVESKSPL